MPQEKRIVLTSNYCQDSQSHISNELEFNCNLVRIYCGKACTVFLSYSLAEKLMPTLPPLYF